MGIATKLNQLIKPKQNKGFITLASSQVKEYDHELIQLLKTLINKKHIPGVYVAVNKPYNILKDKFEKEKINTDMIIFVDVISNMSMRSLKDENNVIFLQNPQDLTDISIALNEAVESIQSKQKFVIIDSLSTLLVYNNQDMLTKFFHFFIGRMRDWNVFGFILSVKSKKEREIINEIGQFCDIIVGT